MPAEQKTSEETAFRDRLGQVRHDLNTPVGHIMGYSEMLEEEIEDELPEVIHDLRSIRSSGERLLELINDHLGAGKQSADEIDLNLTSMLMRQQLNHVGGYCEMVQEVAEETGHDDLTPDLDRIHSATATLTEMIEQLLLPGSLSVSPADLEISSEADEDDLDGVSLPVNEEYLGKGGELLVVDDDPANLDLLSRRLIKQGYTVTTASGGQEALDLLDKQKFDLLILDMMMPVINGLQVLRRLKSDPERKSMPVIMISALDDTEKVVECISLGPRGRRTGEIPAARKPGPQVNRVYFLSR
jgi:CheY-like chemotaxis protein